MNTACCPIIRHSADPAVVAPGGIDVNPHNTSYDEETGTVVQKMSILDKLRISIKFNLTENCNDATWVSGNSDTAPVFTGDGLKHLAFLWRPIFFSFPEKLQAADDDTTFTVETILALTSDDTNEDVVPLTTNKLPVFGGSDLSHPISNVNDAEVFGDFNYTTDTTMEDHVWDEDQFQSALRRFTNKGALRACVGRTRHVNLTHARPFKNFYMDKFLPRAIRRVVDRTFLAIQVHVPLTGEVGQDYHSATLSTSVAHLGCKIIANYHEWNSEHEQRMTDV